jgi:hypothetical protein
MPLNALDPATLRKLDALTLQTNRSLRGFRIGNHRSLSRGQGIEFADYRNYISGDNPRNIDWGVYGRTEKLYVRTYTEEQNLSVLIYLDSSNSMRCTKNSDKWHWATNIFAALAYIGIRDRERVLLSSGIFNTPVSISNLPELRSIAEQAIDAPKYATGVKLLPEVDLEILTNTLSKLKTPGIGIILSDFLMPLTDIQQIILRFVSHNFNIIAVQIISHQDLAPFGNTSHGTALDSETGEELIVSVDPNKYLEQLNQHYSQVSLLLQKSGAKFIRSKPKEDLFEFLSRNIRTSGILR